MTVPIVVYGATHVGQKQLENNNGNVICKKETTEVNTIKDESLSRSKRGGLNMLRLGRGLQMLRMGKRSQLEPTEDELKELIFEMLIQQEAEKASLRDYVYPASYPQVPAYPRYRRSIPDYPESDKDVIGIPDLGKLSEGGEEEMKEQIAEEYYPEGYPVYADDENVQYAKRPMSMLRLGKRPMSMLRLGKRPMSMLRLGKRPMSMLRLGKRPMGMLRMGKRSMSMLRMGKRPMSMLRMGKRPMSMLRMGKRPMSMLRLGKKSDEDHSLDTTGLGMPRFSRST